MPTHVPQPPSEDSVPVTQATLEELKAAIAAERRARADAERRSQGRRSAELALAAAERDRDVGTSPALEAARERSEAFARRALAAWQSIDQIRVHTGRLLAVGIDVGHEADPEGTSRLLAVLSAEERSRAEIAEHLSQAGATWLHVPMPARLDRIPHHDPERMAQYVEEITTLRAMREARRKKGQHRRADQLPGSG